MQSLGLLPVRKVQALRGLLFDIDDTVLDHGRLAVATLSALHSLHDSGLLLVGVTGRPVAWGQVLLRQWPVDGMVTENGALSLLLKDKRAVILDRLTPEHRATRRQALLKLALEVQERFPQLHPSDDAFARQADFTLDIGEAVTVPSRIVDAASQFARSRGARVSRSSIHLHLSFDIDDKASGSLRFLQHVFGIDPTVSRSTFAFVGDSDNDAPCFNAYETTIAVANFRGAPSRNPRYITRQAMGAGFVELARVLLQHRSDGAE